MAITKINTPEIFDLGATNTSLKLPTGDTASRPSNPSTGQWRYNTTLKYVEYWDGGDWRQIQTEPGCTTDTVNYPTGTTVVAYYKLDYSAIDETTNNYDGTTTDITYVNGSPYSQAAVFNGSSSGIFISSTGTSVTDYDQDFSISFWFNFISLNASYSYNVLFTGGGTKNIQFLIDTTNGARFQLYNGTIYYVDTGAVSAGNWYHVVATRSKTNGLEIYLNGISKDTNSFIGNSSAVNYKDSIGSYWDGTRNSFNGSIDQVRIYSTALTSSQVTELYEEVQCPCTTNTVGYSVDEIGSSTNTSTLAYYKLDGNANDSTANANNGTWSGTEAYSVAPYGTGGLFNGSSSKISLSTISNIKTYSFWINPDSSGNATYARRIFGNIGGTSYTYSIVLDPGFGGAGEGRIVYYDNTSAKYSDIINFDKWSHIAFTSDGTTLKTYTNGSLSNTYTTSGFVSSINEICSTSSNRQFKGSIDQVRIFSTDLTSSQVTDLYNEVYCNTISTLDVFGGSTGVALYQLENNANSTDSSSNNGTWTGTEAYAGGYFDKAADLNSSAIETPSIIPANNFSFSVWVNLNVIPTSSSNLQIIYNVIRTSPQVRWYIAIQANGKIEAWNGASTFVTTSNYVVNTDEWYHIVYTASNSTGKNIYVNGEFKQNFADNADNQGSSTPQWQAFGRYFNSANPFFFDGKLDQARVFNKALTAFEVLQLYSE